jgi:hypothetical protein
MVRRSDDYRPDRGPLPQGHREKIVREQRLRGRRYRLQGLVKDEPPQEQQERVEDEQDV